MQYREPYDPTSDHPAQRVIQAMGAARNIKCMITTNPAQYNTPQFRAALADMVYMARLHNHQYIRTRTA